MKDVKEEAREAQIRLAEKAKAKIQSAKKEKKEKLAKIEEDL